MLTKMSILSVFGWNYISLVWHSLAFILIAQLILVVIRFFILITGNRAVVSLPDPHCQNKGFQVPGKRQASQFMTLGGGPHKWEGT